MKRLRKFFAVTRRWRTPRKVDCLIYGASGSEILLNYLPSDTGIFRHHDDELNISVLIRSAIKFRANREGYLKTYLQIVQPRVVLTMEDNDPLFYRIAVWFPRVATVAIQNGRRDHFSNDVSQGFFEQLAEYSRNGLAAVSHLCLFGPAVESLYGSALAASSVSPKVWYVGSLKNNAVKGSSSSYLHRRLFYVSSLPAFSTPSNSPESDDVAAYYGDKAVTYRDYWRIESVLPRYAYTFAQTYGIEFHVLGKRSEKVFGEKNHYDRLLGASAYRFHYSHDQSINYKVPTSNDLIVSSESTLAYEFFARGYRVAFVAARLKLAGLEHRKDCDFGFPLNLPRSGPFWTHDCTSAEVSRVLDFVNSCNNDVWQEVSERLRAMLMAFDEQNHLFCDLLDEVGIHSSGPRHWQSDLIPSN